MAEIKPVKDAYGEPKREKMESKILEGLDALDRGEGCEMTGHDWERLRAEYDQRIATRFPNR